MEISGKVAMVTGAASGVGRATARGFATRGATVVIADVDKVGGEHTVRQIKSSGDAAIFVEADVSTPIGIHLMFEVAERTFGGVDILHNNAAIVAGGSEAWPRTPLERAATVVAVNLGGVIMGTCAAIDVMARRGGGVVVNTGALVSLAPFPPDPVYAASKAGITIFTQSCKTLNDTHNIRVNGILLSFVNTPFIAKAGDGVNPPAWAVSVLAAMTIMEPEEVAVAVIELVENDFAVGEMRIIGAHT